jgi:hypothetical protein
MRITNRGNVKPEVGVQRCARIFGSTLLTIVVATTNAKRNQLPNMHVLKVDFMGGVSSDQLN